MAQSFVSLDSGDLPVQFEYHDDSTSQTVYVIMTFSGLTEAYANHHVIVRAAAEALVDSVNASNEINELGNDYRLVSVTKLNTSESIPLT